MEVMCIWRLFKYSWTFYSVLFSNIYNFSFSHLVPLISLTRATRLYAAPFYFPSNYLFIVLQSNGVLFENLARSWKLKILATISRKCAVRKWECVAKECKVYSTLLTLCIAVYAKQPLQAMYFKSLLHRDDRYYVLWCYASDESRRAARDDSRGFRTFLRDTLPRSLINDRFRSATSIYFSLSETRTAMMRALFPIMTAAATELSSSERRERNLITKPSCPFLSM